MCYCLVERSKRHCATEKIGATDEEIIDAAKQANAHLFVEGFPDKYETIVARKRNSAFRWNNVSE